MMKSLSEACIEDRVEDTKDCWLLHLEDEGSESSTTICWFYDPGQLNLCERHLSHVHSRDLSLFFTNYVLFRVL